MIVLVTIFEEFSDDSQLRPSDSSDSEIELSTPSLCELLLKVVDVAAHIENYASKMFFKVVFVSSL